LSFVFIRPEWLARFVAITGFSLVAPIAILVFGLTIEAKIAGGGGYFAKPRPERNGKNIVFVYRAIIVIFGLFMFYVGTIPTLYDAFQLTRQGGIYLKQIQGRVTNNSSPFGMYFFSQGLKVEIQKGEKNENCEAIFLPRHANLGQTYKFLIAPKSGMVLDYENASPSTNSY
jgi:hypothetical protein